MSFLEDIMSSGSLAIILKNFNRKECKINQSHVSHFDLD